MPLRLSKMRRELSLYATWYNQHRPHQALDGRVPLEVYYGVPEKPSPADPRARPVQPLLLRVSYLEQRKHLPVVELKEAA